MLVGVLVIILMLLLLKPLAVKKANPALAGCQNNLQKIYIAMSIYQNDNKGAFPSWTGATSPSQPLSLLVPKSTTVTKLFICPGSKDLPLPEAESFAGRKISYAYYMGRDSGGNPGEILLTDAQVNPASKSAGQPLFSTDGLPPGNNHGKDGGFLLSVGGEVSSSTPLAARDLTFSKEVRLLNPQ